MEMVPGTTVTLSVVTLSLCMMQCGKTKVFLKFYHPQELEKHFVDVDNKITTAQKCKDTVFFRHTLLTLYQPMIYICVMSSHKPIRIYMGGLILDVYTLHRLLCFFKRFPMVGKGLIHGSIVGKGLIHGSIVGKGLIHGSIVGLLYTSA